MIVVTGSAGLLGSNLILVLLKKGRRVAGLYRSAHFAPPQVETARVDLLDFEELQYIIKRLRPTWIIHCAAATSVDWCESHISEAFRDNVAATRNVALAAKSCAARIVYISTDAVYGDGMTAHTESDEPRPLNVYAESKLKGEEIAKAEAESALIVRTTLYGWNAQSKSSLAEWILRELRRRNQVPGFTDVTFNPLLANDLAEQLVAMIDHDRSGVYNVVGSESCSKYEFAVALAGVFGLDPSLVKQTSIKDSKLAAVRACNSTLDTSKLTAVTGSPTPHVKGGLVRFKALEDSGYVTMLKSYIKEVC